MSSLSVNDIWNSLNDIETKNIEEVRQKKASLTKKKKKDYDNNDNLDAMMHDLLLGQLSELPKSMKTMNYQETHFQII
jgi:ABC-type phosphate transport system auxiliary subunit